MGQHFQENDRIQKTFVVEKKIVFPVAQIHDYMKHTFREHK